MTKKKTVHIISHTHWDREWYLPYEAHHMRLVRLMDELLELFDRDADFRSFHLDGQTIMLEDYLQVRPERKEKLVRLVQEGRLHIGPWYILQDEFLTSSEANVRNLLIGHEDAKAYGAVCKVGYFPDSFGNMGQAPQIIRQAGIECAVYGRGVKPTGFNNEVQDGRDYESPYSEMYWEGPDGSRVLGLLFANWYHNGMEIPVSEDEARTYWSQRLAAVERYASTGELLFMNGCDHQPVQLDLSEGIRTAQSLYPDVEFVHSSFAEYIKRVQQAVPDDLAVIKGELRSQRTNGRGTLVNTASVRMYIKQANQRTQTMLEKVAEPLAVFARLCGAAPYPHAELRYAWKTLMQNHPHDSICGCSVDEVHREMMVRFDKSYHAAETMARESLRAVAARIDTTVFGERGSLAAPFAVFNTTGWRRSGVVSVELDVERAPLAYARRGEIAEALKLVSIEGGCVRNDRGEQIEAHIEDLGVHFGYDLPDRQFRQPYMARKIRVTFLAEEVPALGYAAYAWLRRSGHAPLVMAEAGAAPEELVLDQTDADAITGIGTGARSGEGTGARSGGGKKAADELGNFAAERMMENEYLIVAIAEDGAVTLTDKPSGIRYEGLLLYEDTGDIGNEYMYKQPQGEEAVTTRGLKARIKRVEQSPYRTVYELEHQWDIPACAEPLLEEEQRLLVPIWERKARRVDRKAQLIVNTRLTLEKGARRLDVRTSFNNTARDHRLRVLLPTGLDTAVHRADSIFEIAERPNKPYEQWTNPSYDHHQQAFVQVGGEQGGLTVANLGLPEYEVLQDGRNTVALTLLRCVGELGDWGYFPTPEAQCLGEHACEYALIPHGPEGPEHSYIEAYQLQAPWQSQQTAVQSGALPSRHTFLEWEGEGLALSAVKMNDESDRLVARWFNMRLHPASLRVAAVKPDSVWRRSQILEEAGAPIAPDPLGVAVAEAGPAEIVTLMGDV